MKAPVTWLGTFEAGQASAELRGDIFHSFHCESAWLLQWWRQQASRVPAWATIVKTFLTIQPSSAAAERAFSRLEHLYIHHNDQAIKSFL